MTFNTRARLLASASLAASLALATAAIAQEHGAHDHHDMPPVATAQPADMPPEESMAMEADTGMVSALGAYPMTRDASGTSWQPDVAPHDGLHVMKGDWMIMGHALINGVYATQDGPRGDDKAFLAGMAMATASRPLGAGTLQLKAMLSPDPLMGGDGYPLLLAAGESANGVDPLIDRQHPHDLFMELAASWSVKVGDAQSLFLYGGLPGEPAFGPPAFMHRTAAMDSPEAPITHHWFDSTHITFGVVTAGFVSGRWKVEASAFRGREPDEERWDIETGELDSRSARLSFNPTENWSLQASWASIISPEALEPHHDEERVSVSALYAKRFGSAGLVSGTAAWARKQKKPDDVELDAWLFEGAVQPDDRWTLFARAEQIDTDELTLGGGHGPAYTVRKLSIGAIHDWRLSDSVKVGVGALINAFDIPAPLDSSYGDPGGGMAFVRLKVG
ncbi:MAG: hypothetical protein V4466_12425 [Pseudomonadota bacterium]